MKKIKTKRIILIASLIVCFLFISITAILGIAFGQIKLDKAKLTSFNNGIVIESANDSTPTLHNTTRTITSLANLPEYVKDAFIAVEDKNFYTHNGYDFKRILKSLIVNIVSNSKSQGASTISQQLIKNALLTNEKTYSRKFKELILSPEYPERFRPPRKVREAPEKPHPNRSLWCRPHRSPTVRDASRPEISQRSPRCFSSFRWSDLPDLWPKPTFRPR